MTLSVPKLLTKLAKLVFVACVLAASVIVAHAQKVSSLDPDQHTEDVPRPFAAAEEEMRAKTAIRGADKEYQENLGRARDLSFLGNSILTSFKQKNVMDREDVKKLDRVEKLAKSIRRAAGGEEEEVQLEKPPKDLAAALDMLGEMTKSLKEKVEKTPKHVVSAAVIAEANALLELIRIVRTLPPQV